MTRPCPSFEELSRFLDGALGSPAQEEVSEHVSSCAACAGVLCEMSALDGLVPLSFPQASVSACPRRVSLGEEHLAHLAECALCRRRLAPARFVKLSRAALPLAAAALLLLGIGISIARPGPSMTNEEIDAQIVPPHTQPHNRVAVLEGGAEVTSGSSERGHPAAQNESLRAGDRVVTASGQRVKLSLSSDTELVLNERSALRIEKLGEGQTGVRLEEGELLATASRPFEIAMRSGTAAIAAGEVHVVTASDQTTVAMLQGKGEFRGAERAVALERGQEIQFRSKGPLKVRRLEKRLDTTWAEAMQNVFYQDEFASPELSPMWRVSDDGAGAVSLADVAGRRALSLTARPRERKQFAYAGTVRDFPAAQPISFEMEYRLPHAVKGARVQILLPTTGKGGAGNLRWYLSPEDEVLEAHGDLTGKKHNILWKAREPVADSEWHRLKIVLTPKDVTLYRDGRRLTQQPHGLPTLERVGLVVGGMTSRKVKDPLECQLGRVLVRRNEIQ